MTETTTTARTSAFRDDTFWAKHNSDRSQRQIAKATRNGDTYNWCAVCGATLNPERAQQVHIVAGGSLVLHPADEALYTDDGGDMGCWAVGPECAKLVPAAYRATYGAPVNSTRAGTEF